MNINQYTSIELRYSELEEKLKLSSKHNTNNNNLFAKNSQVNERKLPCVDEELTDYKEKNDIILPENYDYIQSHRSLINKSKKKGELIIDFLGYN